MSALSTSAKGATLLILLQVSTRALTFIVNQVLLRYVSPELLGLEAQLALYSITVLYFSRESIRVAVQRRPEATDAVVNMSYVSIMLGVPLAFFLAKLYLQSDHAGTKYFEESLYIYATSCIAQLFTEPAFVVAQQKLRFGIRASSEGIATVLKCFATCGVAIYGARNGYELGVLPFAIGDFTYGIIRFISYTAQMWFVAAEDGTSLLPQRVAAKYASLTHVQQIQPLNTNSNNERFIFGLFSTTLSTLALSLWLQDSMKYILTQGDTLLITALASLSDQGAYALASNYGGLIARMLFQPIEESSRNLMANLCAPDSATGKPTATGLAETKRLLGMVLKLYNVIGLIAIAIGPTLAPLLLRLVAGSRWSSTGAGDVLATYCYYIPFLAINGLTEAFVAAVASSRALGGQSLSMGVFFVAFASSAWFLLEYCELGAVGLVYANCVNMGLRILFNVHFIREFYWENKQVRYA
jgi:oligosaccharide translocation protein RFT1